MKNNGKRFEDNFKKSIPDGIFFYRFKDSGTSFGTNNKIRFTPKNLCDCELYNGSKLYLLELKSTKGKSIPFGNLKRNEKDNRLEELLLTTYYKNIVAGLVIEFSELDRCFYIDISHITSFMRTSDRKSIDIDYIATNGIEIEITKKRVNNSFNIKRLLGEI